MDHIRPVSPDKAMQTLKYANVPTYSPDKEVDGHSSRRQIWRVEFVLFETHYTAVDTGNGHEALNQLDRLSFFSAHS